MMIPFLYPLSSQIKNILMTETMLKAERNIVYNTNFNLQDTL